MVKIHDLHNDQLVAINPIQITSMIPHNKHDGLYVVRMSDKHVYTVTELDYHAIKKYPQGKV